MQPILLKRPYRQKSKRSLSMNIFQSKQEDHLPPIYQFDKLKINKTYDFVGSKQLRNKIIKELEGPKKTPNQVDNIQNSEERNSILELSKSMRTTINRNIIMSKINVSQRGQLTRDKRNIQRYKQYQEFWMKEIKKIKKYTDKKGQLTLIQIAKQEVKVIPNQQKNDILNNYVNSYWQMSLRNNNVILKRHLQGNNRYSENELQQLLQRESGVQQVQNSIPRLPIEKLKRITKGELSISGRNKLLSQNLSMSPSIASMFSSRQIRAMSEMKGFTHNEQVYKMLYDGSHKWRANEGL